MESIKFISPSSFFYWEKCPLKAIFSKEFRSQQIFPKHPDADLGSIIHSFYENKIKWEISSNARFEERWADEINKIDTAYKQNNLQKIYFPINWNAKYFGAKKHMLKRSILKERKLPSTTINKNGKFEQWIDDGENVGGYVDFMIFNEEEEITEIVDFKTGNIFEFVKNKKVIKMAYVYQLGLYAHIIKNKQNFYPKCFIQDIKGNKYSVEITEEFAHEIYKNAKELKNKINLSVNAGDVRQLANPSNENCSHCDYRPVCIGYKKTLINNFKNKHVDVFGEVIEVKGNNKIEVKIQVESKILTLKNISTSETISTGDSIYVYNLFCPDGESKILFAMKETLIKHE